MYEGDAGGGETLRFDAALPLRPFAWLSVKLGLLNLVTLTLYRFWGKTEVRREVWTGVRLNDEPFEYTGRGMELFIGFLLAVLAVGAPFLLVVFAAQLLHPIVAVLLIGPLYLFAFFLIGFGIFTAFRYALSRTRWRGIRFRLRGSARAYGGYFLLMVFARGLSLGWASPAVDMFLAEQLWGGLTFGDRKFRWSRAHVVNLWGRYAIGWVAALFAYILFFAAVIGVAIAVSGDTASPEIPPGLLLAGYAFAVVLLVVVAAAFTPYHAGVLREVAASLRLDDARFSLRLRSRALLWLAVSNVLLLVFTLGFAAPFVQARTARFMVERLGSEGEARLDEAQQTQTAGPTHGEGLADAFGLSPI